MKKRKKKRTQAVRILDQQQLRKQQRRWWLKISATFLVISVIFLGWLKLHDPKLLPIQVVTIEGDYPHIDPKALKQAIQPYTRSNFFTVNLVGLRERLLQFSWLHSVFISKEWPNRLHVYLKEQQPLAIWNENTLLNDEGNLFSASKNKLSETLPSLHGPLGEQNRVWQMYSSLNKMLAPLHLTIKQLTLTLEQTWVLELNNGLRLVLGQQDTTKRLQRFIRAYPALTKDNVSLEYIDLRYSHGMAVKYANTDPKNMTVLNENRTDDSWQRKS